ncbi:DUF6790 family protein [Sphingomonas bacterium]|uniref:DUF6790 family protein n=1 Tax=Sphingomonas bacterium TaxID=1895847 RepID=UPI0026299C74|nr:DUF6790 family protein [Sphingomonas bacterium]MDB5678016.1 hypothetical protein [Sphingomonas bacterium]
MYIAIVLCLMLIFPFAGIGVEYGHAPLMALVGKWFVFFGVGWRLAIAGIRQIAQPRFTAEHIFNVTGGGGVLVLVRELGFANLGTGLVGIVSLWRPDFTLPTAIVAGIFYAAAGVMHSLEANRSTNENVAMVSDLGIAIVLAAYVVWRLCI